MFNFYWIYDIPNWALCTLIIFSLSAFSAGGILFTRKIARRIMGKPPAQNEAVGIYISAIGVFYGITVGLIAVGAWDTFNSVSSQTDQEAAMVAALYQNVSTYPNPDQTILQTQIRDYTHYVINDAWPLQQKGVVPQEGGPKIAALQKRLTIFEPKTAAQNIIHTDSIQKFGELSRLRRLRLQSVQAGLPGALWTVVIIGALFNILLTYMLVLEDIRPHIWLSIVFAAMMGLLIFLTAAMDNPFRGEFSVTADSFQLIYNQLMKTS
jgi:uncharacterized protein YneF (UPF0154 family)